MEVRVPVERPPPGVEDRQESALDTPVVFLEEFECLGCGPEEHIGCDPVVRLEKIMKLSRNGKDHVKMRAVRQALADLLRPFRLAWTQAIRAMAVTA